MIDERLLESTQKHEGFRNKAYQDTEGVWTIGWGTNLQELVVDETLARKWLIEKLEDAACAAERFPEYPFLDTDARQNVFVEMIYNMGPSRVAGFKNMLRAFREQDWVQAHYEMLDSKWARQVGSRAVRMAEWMRNGFYEGFN